MSLAGLLEEERRLAILQALAEDDDNTLGEAVLRRVLRQIGHGLRAEHLRETLTWLRQQELVRMEALPDGAGDALWVVQLTDAGQDVVRGRKHPGVARA